MIKRGFGFILFIVFASWLVITCDPFREDLIIGDKKVTFNHTEYYILPGSSVVIDLKSVVKESFVSASLIISKQPTKGKISQLDTLLVKYQPDSSFVDGNDQFTLSVQSAGKIIKTENVTIYMTSIIENFPCAVYAVEDFALTAPDLPVTLKFLANDRICGVAENELQISIHSNPKHGDVILSGDSVVYTPGPGYLGKDEMVYKIVTDLDFNNNENDGPVTVYGIINLVISAEPCRLLTDSYILDLTDDSIDPLNTGSCSGGYDINVWVYDKPCFSGEHISVDKFKQTNYSGSVCFGMDTGFSYYPNDDAIPKNDTAQFDVCINGTCKKVFIYVVRESRYSGKWTILPDRFTYARCLHFLDDKTGFIGGTNQLLLKTTNGGESWKDVSIGTESYVNEGDIQDIHFPDGNHGYAVFTKSVPYNGTTKFTGGVLKTTDGGEHWQVIPFLEGGIFDVHFISPSVGFISALNESRGFGIYKTMDAGSSWKRVFDGSEDITDIGFMNSSTGYASFNGMNSSQIKTDDGGESWFLTSGIGQMVRTFTNNDKQLFAVAGNIHGQVRDTLTIWKSPDGEFWSKAFTQANIVPADFAFSPQGMFGMEVGQAKQGNDDMPGVVLSHDGGLSWKYEVIDINQNPAFHGLIFSKVAIPSEKTAYILAFDIVRNNSSVMYGVPFLVKYDRDKQQ